MYTSCAPRARSLRSLTRCARCGGGGGGGGGSSGGGSSGGGGGGNGLPRVGFARICWDPLGSAGICVDPGGMLKNLFSSLDPIWLYFIHIFNSFYSILLYLKRVSAQVRLLEVIPIFLNF